MDEQRGATGEVVRIAGWSGAAACTGGATLASLCPMDGRIVALAEVAAPSQIAAAEALAASAFAVWQLVPAPARGRLVAAIGAEARARKQALAAVITLEVGKTVSEAEGEVQEWIDMCDFAVGLSRQLYGLTIVSERPQHRMMEQWHPLGPVAVITAFNFPMAVFAWNAMLALVCGDSVVWKPSEKASLCAHAVMELVQEVCRREGAPEGLCQCLYGGAEVGAALAAAPVYRLVSATGSTAMGRRVSAVVGARLGRSLLELGGNNAMIVAPSARQELALRAALFSAVGTAGQRCTTLRRLLVQETIAEGFVERLAAAYRSLRVGDPREPSTLVGPLIDEAACAAMEQALGEAVAQGGRVIAGGSRVREGGLGGGFYMRPALVEIAAGAAVVQRETFAPILYAHRYGRFEEAVALQNGVSQGLSSALFSESLSEMEHFLAQSGSDCGIANVNLGTSGAEIGGAFGGEKDTGGGRESGSDAWKSYMRRTTNTVNYGDTLPLAQGVRFEME
ncbi:MAG: aldehyde dehydrogenase family protein [Deltaproteobacteria bacterium]|nr:aldehyde dehydrogenase family protein [Deltaproteobacteria bacterium]